MPSIDIDRYTQPFWFSYSLPKRFDAEAVQVQRSVVDAMAARDEFLRQEKQTQETTELLAAGMSPAELIFMRTGRQAPAKRAETAVELDVKAANTTAEAYARHFGYHPYSEATHPELGRAYKTNLAKLSQHVLDNQLPRLDQATVDAIMGGEKMKQPAPAREEAPLTRGKVTRTVQDLLDYYGLGLSKYDELNPKTVKLWQQSRTYLNQYMLATGEEPDESTVKSIMGGNRPAIPQVKAEAAAAPGVAGVEQPPPESTEEALAQGVERGEVPFVAGEVEQQEGESMEEFGARRTAARAAAIEQAAMEAKGVRITVPVPGGTGETTTIRLRGGLALAASKLLPDQIQEYGELLYSLQQEGADPALVQQLTNILSQPEKAQHLLRVIRDDVTRRQRAAAAKAAAGTPAKAAAGL